MATPVTSELRSQIITSIKGGMSIIQAAEVHQIAPKTISKWMRQINKSANASSNELQKARKHIEFLEHVILGLVLEQKTLTYKS